MMEFFRNGIMKYLRIAILCGFDTTLEITTLKAETFIDFLE